jgi:hypothetical protein
MDVTWVPGMTCAELERQQILAELKYQEGNKTQTAKALGIAPRTLDYKLKKYQEEDEERVAVAVIEKKRQEDQLKAERGELRHV